MDQSTKTVPVIPDHEMLRCVGRGSYGEVWLARSVMGTFRAVKVVYRDSFESERPYEREFGGLQKFEPVSRTHPGLVSVLHIGRSADGACFYCVMEVADDISRGQAIEPDNYRARTLASDIAQRGRLPLEECLSLGIALAAALGHLHSRGLVHRDIKPSNIIFVNGAPKFADIGLVTDIGAKATFVGTEGYLPPEGPGAPGADLYGLGKLLYEISMGKSAEQFPELPTRLRELPDAPALMRLNAIVLKACEPQVAKRFRSAEEMEAALADLKRELKGSRGNGENGVGGLTSRASVLVLCPSSDAADTSLAKSLDERLKQNGLGVRLDGGGTLSVEWARAIEQQIRAADAVIAIVSPATVHSEMLAYAFEIAERCAGQEKTARITVALCAGVPTAAAQHLALGREGTTWISMDGHVEKAIAEVLKALGIAHSR